MKGTERMMLTDLRLLMFSTESIVNEILKTRHGKYFAHICSSLTVNREGCLTRRIE